MPERPFFDLFYCSYNTIFRFFDHLFNFIIPINTTVKLRNQDREIFTAVDSALVKKLATK